MFKLTKRILTGQEVDPVFGFMTFAVVLAVSCSFILRTVVGGGPQSAQAQNQISQSPILQGYEGDTRPTIKPRPLAATNRGRE